MVIGVAGREPSSDQVRALQNLVAGAVPNLKPDHVTIVDQNAKLLGGGDGDAAAGQAADDQRPRAFARKRADESGTGSGKRHRAPPERRAKTLRRTGSRLPSGMGIAGTPWRSSHRSPA